MNRRGYCLEVRGELACFTRPEMKVERVSYEIVTPSAARAVFDAVFWKPAIRWQVRRIEVLEPVRWTNLRRNEVAGVVPTGSVQQAMKAGHGALALYADEDRQQRAALLLRDVAYRLHADLVVRDDRDDPGPPQKFFEIFERRAKKGQCVNQPYLGCREFAARWRLVETLSSEPPPISETRDLGWMLHDLDFTEPADPQPKFFHAQMVDGVVQCDEREVEMAR
jgi:CRISPR-associated protein Cas5d